MSFFTRWFWYHRLTRCDVCRMWLLFLIHVCIVAGICLPILILAGLKRGHVTKLGDTFRKSPTGRQVIFFSATRGEIMTDESVERFERLLPDVDLIIPELQVVAKLRQSKGGDAATVDVTLRSSRQGDPILAQHKADVIRAGENGLVLSGQASEQLGVGAGDRLTLILFRKGGEEAEVACHVGAVLAPEAAEGNVGFADVAMLNRCQQYIKGFGVPEWNLPTSAALQAADKYPGYLIFCKKTDDFRDRDRKFFEEKGYRLEAVKDVERRTLFGLLNAKSLQELTVYYLCTVDSEKNPHARLSLTPTEIGKWASSVDDVIIPWNEPRELIVDGRKWRLIGCTFPDPTWLRRYVVDPALPFDYDAEEFRLRVSHSGPSLASSTVHLPLSRQDQVELAVEATSAEEPKPSGSVTPAEAKPAHPVPDDGSVDSKAAAQARLAEATRAAADARLALQPLIDVTQDLTDGLSPYFGPMQPLFARLRQMSGDALAAARVALTAPPHRPAAAPATAAGGAGDQRTSPAPPKAAQHATVPPDRTTPLEPFVAVVPIQLLAHLDAYDHGVAKYDRGRKCFVPPPDQPRYNQARLYARTFHHVKAVVGELTRRGFGHISEKTRIDELDQADASLSLLVRIVTWVVGLFGVVTVGIVLLESTNRKRREIGILRIMGASGYAVLYMVMLRAALIGVGAAILAAGLGWWACELLSWEPTAAWKAGGDSFWATAWNQLLAWKPVTSADLELREDWQILCVAMLCSLVGSIAPAVVASRLDPFDALVQAKDS